MGRCGPWSPGRPERSATRSPPLCSTGATRCGRWSAIRSAQRASSRPAVEPVRGDVTDAEQPGRGGRGLRAGLQLDGDAGAVGAGRGDLRPGQRRRQRRRSAPRRSGPGSAASSTPRLMTSSTPTPASASTRRWSPTTRRAPRTSAPSSTPRSWCSAERDGMEVVILNPPGVYGPHPIADAVLRERDLRAGGQEAAPGRAPGRHRLRLRRGGRRRATCSPPKGERRRALHPRRRLRELPRAGRDGQARSPAVAASRR